MNVRRIIPLAGIVLLPAAAAFAAHQTGAEEETFSIWGGYPGEAIWTLVWFVVLLAVLGFFAWKPLLTALRSREEHIEREIADAENKKTEAGKTLDEYKAQLADAERQGREILTQRLAEAELKAKEIQSQSAKEIERLKLRMEADLERGRIEAEEALWQEAGLIIRRLGREVFGKSLDGEDDQKLIREAIDRLKESEQTGK